MMILGYLFLAVAIFFRSRWRRDVKILKWLYSL